MPLRQRDEAGGEWMLYGNIGGPGGNWMWLDLTTLGVSPTTPAGFHVKQVINQAMVRKHLYKNFTSYTLLCMKTGVYVLTNRLWKTPVFITTAV